MTLGSGLNLSASKLTVAAVAASVIGGTTYFISTKKASSVPEGSENLTESSSQSLKNSKPTSTSGSQDYSKLFQKDLQLSQKNAATNSSSANNSSAPYSNYDSSRPSVLDRQSENGFGGNGSENSTYDTASNSGSRINVVGSEDKRSLATETSEKTKKEETQEGNNNFYNPKEESSPVSSPSSTVAKPIYFSSLQLDALVVGVCNEVKVSLVDALGNSAATTTIEEVSFTHSSQGKFYSDASCSDEITDRFKTKSGDKDFSVYFKNTKAESAQIVLGTLRNFIPKLTITLNTVAADVSSLVLSADETKLKTSTCVGPFSVKQYDMYSNLAASNTALSYTLSGAGSSNLYSDAACTTSATASFSTSGADTGFQFYAKNSLAENLNLNIDDTGSIAAGSLSVQFGPSQVQIGTPASFRSGDCTAVSVSFKDGLGNTAASLFNHEIALSEASSWSFYDSGDSGCTGTAITKINMSVGDSVKNIYFKPLGHGSAQLTATESNAYFASSNSSTPVGPRKLIWEHDPVASANQCFTVKVKTFDFQNQLAAALTAININLTDSSGSANFYGAADTTCAGAAITSITLPSGSDNVVFHFRGSAAETVNVTAADAASALSMATSDIVVGPNQMQMTGPSPVRSGDCNQYVISPTDALGNPTTALQNYTLNLNDLSASGVFYAASDTTCSGAAISSVNLLNGSTSASFRYKDDKAESVSLNVDDASSTLSSISLPVVVGPRQLDLSGTAQILSGNCATYTVKYKDALGNNTSTTVAHTLNLTDSSPEGVFYSDATCTSVITSKVIAVGTSTSTIYYKNNKQQTPTMTVAASSSELTQATLALNVGPYKLTVAGNNETRAGDCELYAITSKDFLDNTGGVQADTVVHLTDGAAAGNFYASTDTTCSASTISSVTLTTSSSSISYRYKDNTAEAVTLTMSDGVGTGLQDVTQSLNVGPRKLVLSVASTMAAGVCAAVTLKTQDVNSTDKGVIRATTVNLDDGVASGLFYSDAACTAAITSTSFAIGTSSGTIYYKNNKAEVITLAAADAAAWLVSATANTQTGPQQITVTGTTPILAGKCSLYTVTTKDVDGNAAGVLAATTITLGRGASATANFYASTDTTCSGGTITTLSFATNDSTKNFYMKDAKAETISTVTASDGASGMDDGSLAVVVGPDRLAMTHVTPHRSGDCDAITVKTQDAQPVDANAVVDVLVNLTDTSATGNYYSDAACTTGITSTTVVTGTNNTVVYYKDDVKENVTLTGTDAAAKLATVNLNLSIGPRTINLTGSTPILAGTCQLYTVTTKDAAGTTAGVLAATTITLGRGASTTATFYASTDTTCSGAAITTLSFAIGDSAKSFRMKDVKAETISSVTASDGASGMDDGSLAVVVGPDRLAMTHVTPHRSGDCDAITVKTQDAQPADANAISNVTVNLTDTTATGSYYSDAACTTGITSTVIASGTNNAIVYYKDNVKENITLTGTDAASSLTTVNLNLSIGPRTINLTGSTPILAGTCQLYTVTTKDAAGTTAGVLAATTITLGRGASTTATFYASTDTTCSGAAITTLSFAIGDSAKSFRMKDVKAETISSVTASDGASGMDDGSLTVVVGPDRLVLVDTPPHRSGDCDAITVKTQDAQPANANTVSNVTVNLTDTTTTGNYYSDAACTNLITSTSIASGSGSKVVYYKDDVKENVTITATDAGSSLSTANLALSIGPATLELTGASPVRASDCTVYTVKTKDAAGAVSGVLNATTMTLSPGASSTAVFYASTDTTCTGAAITTLSFAAGDNTKTFRMKDPKAESFTMSVDDGPGALNASNLPVVVGPSKLAITGRVGISWNYCRQYNIRARDELNNDSSTLFATTLNLNHTGSVQYYADADTTCTGAPITTLSFPLGTSVMPVRILDATKELVTLTIADQASYLASGTLNVEIGAEKLAFTAGPTPIRSGECSLYTFESQDADNIPQNVLSNTTITVDDQAGSGLMYASTDTTCTGAPITSVTMSTGTSQQQFRYKDNIAESVQLRVDDGAGGRDTGYYSVVVGPDRLDLGGGNKISINNCTAFSIVSRDTSNNVATLIYNAAMTLTDGSASGDFYDTTDTTCTGSVITTKTMLAGTNSTTVYYKDATSELVTLAIADSGSYLLGDTFATEVGADRFALSGVNYLRADECGLFTLETQNAAGSAQNVLANSAVTLSNGSGAGSFYASADTTCSGAAITSVTVLNGTSSIQFRYKDPKAESVTLNADDGPGGRAAANKALTIGPNKLKLIGSATLNAGQCTVFTVKSQDAQNNDANVNAVTTVNLVDGAAAGVFYAAADTTCSGGAISSVSIANGANSTTFRYKDNTAEAVTLTASDNASYLASSTLSLTVGPGKLVLTGSSPIRSGDCTAYTVVSKDISDVVTNVGANTTINLSLGGGSGQLYGTADSSCSGAAVTTVQLNSGTSSVIFYFKDNKAESTVITVADGTTSMTSDSRTIVTTGRTINLTGAATALSGTCQSYTATVKDGLGNAVNQAALLSLSLSDGSAQGDFYASADTTCSGSVIASADIASGSSAVSFRYKDRKAESITLTVDDGPGALDAGTLALTTTASKLVISGTNSQFTNICGVFVLTTKDDLDNTKAVTSNVNVNLTDGSATGSYYAASDTTCSGAAITSVTVLNGSSSVNFRYKSANIENVTMNADDQAGQLASGTFALSVTDSCSGTLKVEPWVSGAATYNLTTGQTFNVKVTAIDGGGATLSCFTGSKSISWTMNGSNASSYSCSETSVNPIAPSETTMTFSSGVATTTSNVAKFKALESTSTVTATSGAFTGTSNAVTVSVGSVCQVKIRDASAGGGSVVSSKTIDLNVNSSTSSSQSTLYAAGYDGFGNYVSDVTAVWSGTGTVFPWKQTTTTTDDTVKVVGVKIGTGVLQADYAGGGGSKTATVNFTTTSTNSTASWSSSTSDLLNNNILGDNQTRRATFWNVKADAVNSWRTTGSQSWRSESFSTHLRSSRADFPDNVYLVGNNNGLDVIDATNNVLWMRFNSGSGKIVDSAFGSITAVTALNGKVLLGLQLNSSVGSVIIIDFENDTVKRMDSNGLYSFSGNIASRQSAGSWTMADSSKKLSQSSVNDIKSARAGSYDVFAVGSLGGVSVLQYSGATVTVAKASTTGSVNGVAADTTGKVYASEDGTGVHRFDLSLPASGTITAARTYSNSNISMPYAAFNDLNVATGTSTAQASANTLYVGSTHGMIVVNEHSTLSSVTSKVYTVKGSGTGAFTGSLYLNGVDAYGTIADAGISMGPSQGTSTALEFKFSPTQAISSGNYTLLEKGSGAGSLKVVLESGVLKFKYQDATSTVTTLASTTSSWSAGDWHHVAIQIHSSGVEMWVDGQDRKTASVSLSSETISSGAWTVGAASGGTQLFSGQLDELRVSNTTRYTGSTFTVPSAAFSTDANTISLFHFDSRSGSQITYDDTVAQRSLSLVGGANSSLPKIAGTENSIYRITVRNFSGSVTCLAISGSSSKALTEMQNSQNSASLSVSRSQLISQLVDIFYFHEDSATDLDLGYGTQSGGLTLIRN